MAEREELIILAIPDVPEEEPNFSDPEDFVDDVTDEGTFMFLFHLSNLDCCKRWMQQLLSHLFIYQISFDTWPLFNF